MKSFTISSHWRKRRPPLCPLLSDRRERNEVRSFFTTRNTFSSVDSLTSARWKRNQKNRRAKTPPNQKTTGTSRPFERQRLYFGRRNGSWMGTLCLLDGKSPSSHSDNNLKYSSILFAPWQWAGPSTCASRSSTKIKKRSIGFSHAYVFSFAF